MFRSLAVWCLLCLSGAWSRAALAPLVPGYERLHRAGSGATAEAGEVLLSELSCLACHGARSVTAEEPLAWKSGPDLTAAGDRLRPAWLRTWLADPAAQNPGTTMPQLLHGQPPEVAEDLAQYLLSLRGQESAVEEGPGSAEKGEGLFQTVGCIACHSEVPLARLGEKYAPGSLARFLRHPLAVRPAGRMPDLRLEEKEALHLAAYLSGNVPAQDPPPTPDRAAAERGRQAFTTLGCAACHRPAEGHAPVPVRDLRRGCLSETPAAGVPLYPLTEEQRTALRTALAARGPELRPPTLEPFAAVRAQLLQRNCYACHLRGGLGGPAPEIAVHFTSTRDDLGDLGRLPPPLDGAGRKLQLTALERVLRGREPIRQYMRVRMGDFGEALARALPPLFAAADADPKELPTLAKIDPNKVGRNEPGRILVGTEGYACIACHDLYGHASLGLGAYDMAEMPKRLRPEWMRDFLLNPAAFPTGARMPAFWPGGKPLNPKLEPGNDAIRQIDSIRVYLTEADQSLPPPGFVDKAAYEVKATDRPVIFRTFIAGVGTHAIAVAFPAGVNVAFDAEEARWVLAWRGRFLDGDGTWNQRFTKMEPPLGEDLVQLGEPGRLVIAGEERAPRRFGGYRVEPGGQPVFLYHQSALSVEDRMEPSGPRGLRHTVHVSGQTHEQVSVSAQPGAGITSRPAGETKLEFHNGAAEWTQELTW